MSGKPSPLMLAALALGGLFLLRQAQAQKVAVTGVSAKKTADYFTPTDVAGLLARTVTSLTKNIQTPAPSGIFAVDHPLAPGSAASGLAGWENYGGSAVASGDTNSTGDPYNTWIGPSSSSVKLASPTAYSSSVDAIIGAPVYNPGTDFVNNPFAAIGL